MSASAVVARGIGKKYRIDGLTIGYRTLRDTVGGLWHPRRRSSPEPETFWALRDIDFDVAHGEVIGIVGRNGAGKSTLLKVVSRITEPSTGHAEIRGRVGSLLEVGTGFHPELSGRENVYLNGAILGMRRSEIRDRFDEIVAFAEVDRFIDTPVKHYSSGMYLRLAFAVAAHLEPEVLVVDEVLAVGDAGFQRKCLGKMGDVASEGRTVLFVSHNLNAVQRLCGRCILLADGQIDALGPTRDVVARYILSGTEHGAPRSWMDLSDQTRTRRGSGRVRIDGVWYSGEDSSVGYHPVPRGALEVRLRLVSDAPREIGSLAVTLYDQSHTKLVNADTSAMGQRVRLEAGVNVVSFTLRELLVNPGVYPVTLWCASPLGTVYDAIEGAFHLEVVELVERSLGARPRADGVVPCEFECSLESNPDPMERHSSIETKS